jgi:hypothetical protein
MKTNTISVISVRIRSVFIPTGIGGSRHSWPTADNQEDSDVLVWYVIHS